MAATSSRARKHFKSRDEALGEKNSLEVEAANVGGEFRARHTRLSSEQLAEAEAAFSRLGSRPMNLAVQCFLDTYRPPTEEMTLDSRRACPAGSAPSARGVCQCVERVDRV